MPTKLSRYAEGVMEAAWLAAIIVVPLFFNVYSSRIFEPDKIALLRTLALLILGAWVVKLVSEGGIHRDGALTGADWWKNLLKTPLVLPVAALVVVYLVSTAFSVAPRISFWGSYQRLQGTYTTLSYLVIFGAIAANMRQRAQVERMITTVILVSLPVSLYGILQRYSIDPVAWSGDVAVRIAANLGNSIFLAAYLIMAFPLTLVRIVASFGAILREDSDLLPEFTRSTIYIFIAVLQLIAIYFTGSRGPWLGLLASSFFLLVVLSLLWGKRWLTLGIIGAAAALALFLVILNVPNGPLESLRQRPEMKRLGQLLDAESRTGRVRALIWQGAADLVAPGEAITYPDGEKDAFNGLRPLIGYGPESMFEVFSFVYPPELTQVEKRNASADRSHNETWDALVITGVLGIIVYLTVFGAVIYYGLSWLGLISDRRQRDLFLILYIAGGVLSAAGFMLWGGLEFFGVGLPFGMMIGVIVYLVFAALSGSYQPPETEGERLRELILLGLLAGIVAHFVEINFGIAIAVTRTYFWAFTGLLLVVGFVLPQHGEFEEEIPGGLSPKQSRSGGSRRRSGGSSQGGALEAAGSGWLQTALSGSGLLSIVLVTLGFDFITHRISPDSAWGAVWSSLVNLPTQNNAVSYGVLAMILTAWLMGGILFAAESARRNTGSAWVKALAAILGISLAIGVIYWLWHAAQLVSQTGRTVESVEELIDVLSLFERLLTTYYLYLFGIVLVLAAFLQRELPPASQGYSWQGVAAAVVALLVVAYLGNATNLRTIQADIAGKQANPYAREDSWPVALALYNRVIDLAPTEGFYYLVLGKTYLDYGQTLQDPGERAELFEQARADLLTAQRLDPLNTDHTANLARLYALWATNSQEQQSRTELGKIAEEYYAAAVTLSPFDARLWNEWAILTLNVNQDPDDFLTKVTHALEIDPIYYFTHALLADYYVSTTQEIDDAQKRQEALELAVQHYTQALELAPLGDTNLRYNYAVALAGAHYQLNDLPAAAESYQQAIELAPDLGNRWQLEEMLGRIFAGMGQPEKAIEHYASALVSAPLGERERLQDELAQLQSQP